MKEITYTDEEDNVFILVPPPPWKKGDPSCSGCPFRCPGSPRCVKTNFVCHEHKFEGGHGVWFQKRWGAYPKDPDNEFKGWDYHDGRTKNRDIRSTKKNSKAS